MDFYRVTFISGAKVLIIASDSAEALLHSKKQQMDLGNEIDIAFIQRVNHEYENN